MTELRSLSQDFLQMVRQANSVLIGTHLNPDGDALGSALAMSLMLDQLEVLNEVVCHNNAPYNLRFLPHLNKVRSTTQQEHDLGIILDLDAMHRLGSTESFFEQCPHLIVVDHHVPHEEPGDLRIVDPSAPATALILFRLFRELQIQFTPEIATCLLTGIVTDTGSFKYRNTSPESLEAAAFLLSCGGDIVQVSEEVYHRKPLAGVRLLGKCLDHLRLDAEDRIAWSVLRIEDFESTGAKEPHTEGLVNELLAIDSVKIAAVLRQPYADRVIRASIRSREGYDASAVARTFGGGGHRNAAGCTFEGITIEEAERELVSAMNSCLASS